MSDLGNKEIFAKNLNFYIELNNKARADVARDLEIPYSTITDWCNGNVYPRIDKIEILANYFDIKKSDLVENKNKQAYFVPVPVLKKIQANFDYMARENWIDTVFLDKKNFNTGEFFALKVKDLSMFPIFLEGDIIIFKEQSTYTDNTIVVVLNGDKEAEIRKLKTVENGIKLIPFNRNIDPITGEPYFEDLIFTNEQLQETPVKIIGVFERMIRKEI